MREVNVGGGERRLLRPAERGHQPRRRPHAQHLREEWKGALLIFCLHQLINNFVLLVFNGLLFTGHGTNREPRAHHAVVRLHAEVRRWADHREADDDDDRAGALRKNGASRKTSFFLEKYL